VLEHPLGLGLGIDDSVMIGIFLDGSCTTVVGGCPRLGFALHIRRATLRDWQSSNLKHFPIHQPYHPHEQRAMFPLQGLHSMSGAPNALGNSPLQPVTTQRAVSLHMAIQPLPSCQRGRAELQSPFHSSTIGPPCQPSFDCKARSLGSTEFDCRGESYSHLTKTTIHQLTACAAPLPSPSRSTFNFFLSSRFSGNFWHVRQLSAARRNRPLPAPRRSP
jgi:hypothetical protein